MAEVAKHNTPDDAWLAIDGDVYNVTKFIKYHPGGAALLASHAGTDATESFFDMHKTEVLLRYARLKIGRLASVPADKPRAVDQMRPGTLSMVPYAEPAYLQGWQSPIHTDLHVQFRKAVRAWYDEHLRPICQNLEKGEKPPPKALVQKMGKAGILAIQMAPSKELFAACQIAGIQCPGGIPWGKYDLFMEQICHEEHMRMNCPGLSDGLVGGLNISLPCITQFGTPEMQRTVVPEILLGNKRTCLAISEPFAGSDVANLKCTAVKTPDGKHFIVNGVKKWITGGLDADYFVTAVRTSKRGLSLLLVERDENVKTTLIKTSYSAAAATAYVVYENVKVPVENLLGKENKGFACIMKNFNHERWMIVVGLVAQCRVMLHDCILWSNQRKVFGKPLITQPVIMAKLSDMAAQVEAVSSWLESITYQMANLDYERQSKMLAGPIALLKYYSTRVSYSVADHASQILGGRAITRTGMGQNVERFARGVKYAAIYGGSEEIMQTLAAKQMMKRMPAGARL
jgi:alkylation response protein AidB-like acyl-CoA dehydrogenase/predicted heme/steroid binding protein